MLRNTRPLVTRKALGLALAAAALASAALPADSQARFKRPFQPKNCLLDGEVLEHGDNTYFADHATTCIKTLGGHFKTGQRGTVDSRPMDGAGTRGV